MIDVATAEQRVQAEQATQAAHPRDMMTDATEHVLARALRIELARLDVGAWAHSGRTTALSLSNSATWRDCYGTDGLLAALRAIPTGGDAERILDAEAARQALARLTRS